MVKALMTGCAAALLAATAFAAEPASASKGDEMASAKCGDILDLFDAANPKSTKSKRDLAAAQDRAYVFIMWTHGYLSGRDGIDFAKRPLNQAGINRVVEDIVKVCAGDEKRNFVDAMKDVR